MVKKLYTYFAEQFSIFQIPAQFEYRQFHNRLLYSYIKKYINIYKSKYHWVLNKYISGVRKHRPHGDMGGNYVLFSRFHWPYWVFCFVADFYSCVIQNYVSAYVERCLFTPLQHAIYHCNGNWISLCTLLRNSYVTLPPNLSRSGGSQWPLEYINNHQDRTQHEVSSVPLNLHLWNQIWSYFFPEALFILVI